MQTEGVLRCLAVLMDDTDTKLLAATIYTCVACVYLEIPQPRYAALAAGIGSTAPPLRYTCCGLIPDV